MSILRSGSHQELVQRAAVVLQLLQAPAHERGDARRRSGLAGDDLAEEDVVLQRRGAVVAAGIEELDRASQVLRQLRSKMPARLYHTRLETFVDEAQAVPGDDQP